jgi:lipid-A-disaccharide synthase-like uncharacterized protein
MDFKFTFDIWTFIGLMAQGMFFLRFIFQWYYSEKAKKTVVPPIFWYLSMLGAILTVVYALARADVVFLFAGVLQIILYLRSLMLLKNDK